MQVKARAGRLLFDPPAPGPGAWQEMMLRREDRVCEDDLASCQRGIEGAGDTEADQSRGTFPQEGPRNLAGASCRGAGNADERSWEKFFKVVGEVFGDLGF
jgi:hypothetical protein